MPGIGKLYFPGTIIDSGSEIIRIHGKARRDNSNHHRNGIYNYPRKYKLPIPGIIVPSRFTVNSTHHRNGIYSCPRKI
eukprot:g57698.t1